MESNGSNNHRSNSVSSGMPNAGLSNSSSSMSGDDVPDDRWKKIYNSPPLIDRKIWIVTGVVVYLISYLYRPLILVVFFFLSRFISYAYRVNDDAVQRRKQFQLFREAEHHPDSFRNVHKYVNIQEQYWVNDRGMCLCTSIMTPIEQPITAVLCYCHGYSDNASFMKRMALQKFVTKANIAIVTIEYEGHGRSDGLLAFMPCFNTVVHDVTKYFTETVTSHPLFRDKQIPTFLMGESMGAAIAYQVYNKVPHLFKGVVFCAPMCKLKDDMIPPKPILEIFRFLTGPKGSSSTFFGYLPIAPTKAIHLHSCQDKQKGEYMRTSPTTLSGRKPRLVTARELLFATQTVSSTLHEFNGPFLVLHGKEDRITDPNLSLLLYNEAKSTDKSIKLYEGMWHVLISGENDYNTNIIFNDIIEWIQKRSTKAE